MSLRTTLSVCVSILRSVSCALIFRAVVTLIGLSRTLVLVINGVPVFTYIFDHGKIVIFIPTSTYCKSYKLYAIYILALLKEIPALFSKL